MTNKKLIAVFATNDGETFIKDHFGDSKLFLRYEISKEKIKFLDVITNSSEEEKIHADPKKAKFISSILKEQSVQVLISQAFGGNIVRMKKHFACVKCNNCDIIKDFFPTLRQNFDLIHSEWEKGENRDFLVL